MSEFDGFYWGVIALPVLLLVLLLLAIGFRKHLRLGPRLKLAGANLLFLAFLLSLVMAGGETYYRFFVDTTDTFGLSKVTARWGQRHYKNNNYGSRDNVTYVAPRTTGKRRITFLGDSFTAGHGIKNVDDRLANRIRAAYPELEVHVLAANGMESADYASILPQLRQKDGYDFDIVILAYCLNDIAWLIDELDEIYARIYDFNENLSWLERESYFINTLSFQFMRMNEPAFADYYETLKTAYSGDTWNDQAFLLTDIRDYFAARDAEFMVMTWPFLSNLGPEYEFVEVHRQINEFWKSREVEHLDLWPLMAAHAQEDLTVNAQDGHPNERANELAFIALDKFLKARGL